MKTTTIIIAAVLSLQVSYLFAGNDFPPTTPNINASTSSFVSLVPTTPDEATFEDEATFTEIAELAPVTPEEADFSDVVPEASMDINTLAPITPAEADFSDTL